MDYSKIYQEAHLNQSLSKLNENVKKIDEINWGEKSMEERKAFLKEKVSEVHNNLFEVSSKIKETMAQIKSDITPEAKEIKKDLNEMLGIIQDIILLLNKPGLKEIYEEVQRESSMESEDSAEDSPKLDNPNDIDGQTDVSEKGDTESSTELNDISIEEAKEIQQEAMKDLKDSTQVSGTASNGGVK